MKKIIVPQAMHSAAWNAQYEHTKIHGPAVGCLPGSPCSLDVGLEAALQWLSENPPKITNEMVEASRKAVDGQSYPEYRYMFRVAFLAPEPEYPDDVLELLRKYPKQAADVIIAAYRLGQKAGK